MSEAVKLPEQSKLQELQNKYNRKCFELGNQVYQERCAKFEAEKLMKEMSEMALEAVKLKEDEEKAKPVDAELVVSS